ncbi:hypothetical protein Y032_0062g3383 [Ancylostoma ceylanicum]|uniref:Uncharacterized protein n=1 Tax=Ancylostoma ceylanicum TaxID=53326 RepID=A0A016U2P8_9BILA|nr:hypothetical protein Y032_0062g3383 [Ancylostoma ceylanicum]
MLTLVVRFCQQQRTRAPRRAAVPPLAHGRLDFLVFELQAMAAITAVSVATTSLIRTDYGQYVADIGPLQSTHIKNKAAHATTTLVLYSLRGTVAAL